MKQPIARLAAMIAAGVHSSLCLLTAQADYPRSILPAFRIPGQVSMLYVGTGAGGRPTKLLLISSAGTTIGELDLPFRYSGIPCFVSETQLLLGGVDTTGDASARVTGRILVVDVLRDRELIATGLRLREQAAVGAIDPYRLAWDDRHLFALDPTRRVLLVADYDGVSLPPGDAFHEVAGASAFPDVHELDLAFLSRDPRGGCRIASMATPGRWRRLSRDSAGTWQIGVERKRLRRAQPEQSPYVNGAEAWRFRVPAGITGSYEVLDDAREVVASGPVASGRWTTVSLVDAMRARPGAAFDLFVGGERTTLVAELRYGAPCNLPELAVEKALCAPSAPLGAAFGHGVRVETTLTDAVVPGWLLVAFREAGKDPIVRERRYAILDYRRRGRSLGCDLDVNRLLGVAGRGIDVPNDDALNGAVVLFQYVWRVGVEYVISDVFGARIGDAAAAGDTAAERDREAAIAALLASLDRDAVPLDFDALRASVRGR